MFAASLPKKNYTFYNNKIFNIFIKRVKQMWVFYFIIIFMTKKKLLRVEENWYNNCFPSEHVSFLLLTNILYALHLIYGKWFVSMK